MRQVRDHPITFPSFTSGIEVEVGQQWDGLGTGIVTANEANVVTAYRCELRVVGTAAKVLQELDRFTQAVRAAVAAPATVDTSEDTP